MAPATGREPEGDLPIRAWVRSARGCDVGRRVLAWQLTYGGRTRMVLLWRTRRGRVVAIDGECPHRQYLMVDARLVRDEIECPIHGYRFDGDGRCVNVRRAPPARRIDVRETDGYVWLAA